MNAWFLPIVLVVGSFACGWLWRGVNIPSPVVIERVDTLYRPPVPEFIEMFRLQCYWIPEEK